MNNDLRVNLQNRLTQLMGQSSRRSSQLHAQFLQQREVTLEQMRWLIEQQIGSSQEFPIPTVAVDAHPALFTSHQLDEFGAGNFSGCFGPAFKRYDGRRIPRIPNGDLKMMSRVVTIEGKSLNDLRTPARIVVEYDVPADAWYLRDSGSNDMPYSLLMEVALQPCGFLSAYLDTYALVPHEEFYFRNLDGSARIEKTLDVRGKMLTTTAQMLTSVTSGGNVIQKFQFSVSCFGEEIYQGESTFGYFSTATMANQVGLDGGKFSQPWINAQGKQNAQVYHLGHWRTNAALHLPKGRFSLLENVSILPGGGKSSKGYIYARRPVNPQDWFYPFHFSSDPVMPGSLGVEAVLEALKAYPLALQLASGLSRASSFSLPSGGPLFSWRYRGQITPRHQTMELEIHLHTLERLADGLLLAGDASVWVDNLRIYDMKNVSIQMAARP